MDSFCDIENESKHQSPHINVVDVWTDPKSKIILH